MAFFVCKFRFCTLPAQPRFFRSAVNGRGRGCGQYMRSRALYVCVRGVIRKIPSRPGAPAEFIAGGDAADFSPAGIAAPPAALTWPQFSPCAPGSYFLR
ncbi:hypothetical protein HMPREF1631_02985 [Arcanobacterium sp. S3PF19]|nr:hypothetical protein HMPREF1631_02985 [Arcanobacterium sp. S3PF19]